MTVHDLFLGLSPRPWDGIRLKRLIYNLFVVPFVNYTPYGKFLLGGFLKEADQLIVHSEQLKLFLQSLGVNPEKIAVFYLGISEIEASDPEILARLHCEKQRPMTVFGFITPEKGYEIVLKALQTLPSEVRLVIAGDIRTESQRPYLEKLKKSVRYPGIENRVIFTGSLTPAKASPLLESSEVNLLPYQPAVMSGVSYALSFAIAAKRPIVTSDTPYFLELEQKFGILSLSTFSAGKPQSLEVVIQDILQNKEKTLSQSSAVETFMNDWNWDKVAEKTAEIYLKVSQKKESKKVQTDFKKLHERAS